MLKLLGLTLALAATASAIFPDSGDPQNRSALMWKNHNNMEADRGARNCYWLDNSIRWFLHPCARDP